MTVIAFFCFLQEIVRRRRSRDAHTHLAYCCQPIRTCYRSCWIITHLRKIFVFLYMVALGLDCMWVFDWHSWADFLLLFYLTPMYVKIIASCLCSLFLYYSGLLARLIFMFVLSNVKYCNQSLLRTHSLHSLFLSFYRERELMQWCRPVGSGPPSNTCPKCAPSLAQMISVLIMP